MTWKRSLAPLQSSFGKTDSKTDTWLEELQPATVMIRCLNQERQPRQGAVGARGAEHAFCPPAVQLLELVVGTRRPCCAAETPNGHVFRREAPALPLLWLAASSTCNRSRSGPLAVASNSGSTRPRCTAWARPRGEISSQSWQGFCLGGAADQPRARSRILCGAAPGVELSQPLLLKKPLAQVAATPR